MLQRDARIRSHEYFFLPFRSRAYIILPIAQESRHTHTLNELLSAELTFELIMRFKFKQKQNRIECIVYTVYSIASNCAFVVQCKWVVDMSIELHSLRSVQCGALACKCFASIKII